MPKIFTLLLVLLANNLHAQSDFGWQGKPKSFIAFIDGFSFSHQNKLYHTSINKISINKIYRIYDSEDGSELNLVPSATIKIRI